MRCPSASSLLLSAAGLFTRRYSAGYVQRCPLENSTSSTCGCAEWASRLLFSCVKPVRCTTMPHPPLLVQVYLYHGHASRVREAAREYLHAGGSRRGSAQHAHGWMSRWRFSCWARCSATGSGQGPNRGGSLETPRPRPICRHAPQSHCPVTPTKATPDLQYCHRSPEHLIPTPATHKPQCRPRPLVTFPRPQCRSGCSMRRHRRPPAWCVCADRRARLRQRHS